MRSKEEFEEIIDALEYRVAQLEDRVWNDALPTDRKALERRRKIYYTTINKGTGGA